VSVAQQQSADKALDRTQDVTVDKVSDRTQDVTVVKASDRTQDLGVDQAVAVLSALASLLRTSRAAGRRLQEGSGASGTPLTVLRALAREDGPDRPGDLAVAAGVAPSVVSRVLARLEEDGLVTRRRDEADARACRIALTAEGGRHLGRVQRSTAALLAPSLSRMTSEDLDRIPALLAELEQALAHASDRAVTTRHTPANPPTTTESR
jgi:DNA-binding MarR family transcriptional regulator